MAIYIKGFPFPERCGKSCLFCKFEFSDDQYHCLFLDSDPDDVAAVNIHAEDRERYEKCPVEKV